MKAKKNKEMEMEEVFTSVVVYYNEDDKEYSWVEQFDNVETAKKYMKEYGCKKWLWMACVCVNLCGDEFAYATTERGAIKKLNMQLEYYGIRAYDPFKDNE